MTDQFFAAISLSSWFWTAWNELADYFEGLTVNQFGIVAAASVAFGFMCLRGHGIKR